MQHSIINYILAIFGLLLVVSFYFLEDNQVSEYMPLSPTPMVKEIVNRNTSANVGCNCTVTQGPNEYFLSFMSDTMSASEFYAYGNPNGASSNTGLELSETMTIMLYEDLNTGIESLIVIVDQVNDGTGGAGSITFNCLPGSAFVEFSDDGGELAGTPPTITGNFFWSPCCTDGGIIGGVGCGVTMTIDPDFTSGIDLFSLVYGTPTDPIYVPMPEVNCPIVINCGGPVCCEELLEYSSEFQNTTCEDDNSGFIDLTLNCVSDPVFEWSNGETTEDIGDLFPGSYTVTITDGYGCVVIEEFMIEANSPNPMPVITGETEFCEGGFLVLDAGGGHSSYEWSNGVATQYNFVTTSGTFTVTVTNAQGCTGTASTTVDTYPSPQPEIVGPLELCLGDVITLDAGSGYDNYSWSTGSASQTIDVLTFGNYTVTVTNEFGCTGVDNVIVDQLPTPYPAISGPSFICSNSTIELDAGFGFDTYLWSTGSTDQSIAITAGGMYEVTVTNFDGCQGLDVIEVFEFPSDSIVINSFSCNPADTGVFVFEYFNQFGCPSIEINNVSYSESDSVFHFDKSCSPLDTGIFVQEFVNQYGCDSFDVSVITLALSDSTNLALGVCNPQDTGVTIEQLPNQYGCDSTIRITKFLLKKDTTYLYDQSCDSSNAGITDLVYVNQFGCDSLVITEVTFTLIDTNYVAKMTCDPSLVGVTGNLYTAVSGCDSLVITSTMLSPIDTILQDAITCDPLYEGLTESWIDGIDGCDTLVVTNTVLIESDTTYKQRFTCNPFEVGFTENMFVGISGCDSVVITATDLLPSDSIYLYYETCLASDTGTVASFYTNQYACDSIVFETTFLAPPSNCALSTIVFEDTIGCFESTGSLWLDFGNGTPPYQYTWKTQSGNTGSGIIDKNNGPQEILGLVPGFYTLDISDPNGLVTTVNGVITQLEQIESSLQVVSAFNGSDISCFGANDGEVTASIVGGGLPPYQYSWSNSSTSPTAIDLEAGIYTVTITGEMGCITVDSISLISPDSLHYSLNINQPDCFNGGLGTIAVDKLDGGTLPYQYGLNKQIHQSEDVFTNLTPGNYILEVIDANGCTASTTANINSYMDLIVSLGKDTVIEYGDSLRIEMDISTDMDAIEWIDWEGINCTGCPVVTVSPLESTTYYISIQDTLGCRAEDEMEVMVRHNYGLYFPNAFSPDNNGINDYFTIYGDESLQLIKTMSIFDRWGEKVYFGSNLSPNNPTEGWNGNLNGQPLNPGVYIFLAEVQFLDGIIHQIQGEVTIIN